MTLASVSLPCVSMFFIWTSLYCILCIINPHQSYEWNCRLLTIIHASLTTLLSYWCAFITGPWAFDALGAPNTPLQSFITTFTLGYFLFDFLWCLSMGNEGLDMLLHHAISLSGLTYVVMTGHSGSELVATTFGSEVSNPFLQLRWFMRETGQYESLAAKINDVVFMSLFLFWRLGPGSFLCYYTISAAKPGLFIKIGGLSLYIMGWMWAFFIIKFARKRFWGKRKTATQVLKEKKVNDIVR